jgi:hypothetical protein
MKKEPAGKVDQKSNFTFDDIASPAAGPDFTFDDIALDAAPEVPVAQKIETGARSAIEGITGGVSEPVISTINAMVGNLIDAGFDADSAADLVRRSVQAVSPSAEGKLRAGFEADIARRRELEQKIPEVALPAEVGGAVLGGLAMPLGGAATGGLAAKALTAAPRAAEALGAVAARAVPAALGAPVKAAARGAAAAGSAEAIKQAVQEPSQLMEGGKDQIAEAAAFGGKFGGALGVAGSALKAIPDVSKKLLMAFGGVDERSINKYLKDPQAFTRAKSAEELKDMIDAQAETLAAKVSDGELSVKQAKEVLVNTRLAVSQEKSDVKARLKEAISKFDEEVAVNTRLQKEGLTAGRVALRDQVQDALDALKQKVVQGSELSYKALEKSGITVEMDPALAAAKNALESLKIKGKAPTVGSSAAAFGEIEGYVKDLKGLGKKLSASEAKQKIQQLDQDFDAIEEAGGFSDAASNAIKSIRRAFDAQLKTIPEYAQIMEKVRADAELLTEARKRFGTIEKANGKIARIEAPDRANDRRILAELGKRVGMPFDVDVAQIQQTVTGLKPEAIAKSTRSMPQAREIGRMKQQLATMSRQGYMESVEQVVAAEQRMARQQNALAEAQAALKSIGPFARPASNINAIATAVKGKNPEYINYLQSLTQISETDFVQAIDDLRLADAFAKEFRIGSRNVNFWAIAAGTSIYAMTGSTVAAAAVAGLGGNFGALVDRFGPRMVQKVLDGYLKIEGLPTVQKLNRVYSDLPKPVLEQLKNDLIRSMATAPDEPLVVSEEQKAAVSQDVMVAKISSLEKSRMLLAIQNDEPVSTQALMRIAMGGQMPQAPVKWTQ